jgi:hypothetical protein
MEKNTHKEKQLKALKIDPFINETDISQEEWENLEKLLEEPDKGASFILFYVDDKVGTFKRVFGIDAVRSCCSGRSYRNTKVYTMDELKGLDL